MSILTPVIILVLASLWTTVAVAEDAASVAFPLGDAAAQPQTKSHTTVTQCTTTCSVNRNPTIAPPANNPMASVFTATPPEKSVFVPLKPDASVTPAPVESSDWDVQVECRDYKEKFWQWRITKCQEADPKWVSPGLGKTNH